MYVRVYVYLDVGGEEGELERPSVLHAAGDHAGEDEPAEAERHRRLHRSSRAAAAATTSTHRELQLAAARHGRTDVVRTMITSFAYQFYGVCASVGKDLESTLIGSTQEGR